MELLFCLSRWWFSYSVLLMLTEVYSQRTETLRLECLLNIWMRKRLWFHHCYLVRHDCSSPSWMTFMNRKQVGVSMWIIQMIIAAVGKCSVCAVSWRCTTMCDNEFPHPLKCLNSFLSFDRCVTAEVALPALKMLVCHLMEASSQSSASLPSL